MLPHTDVRREPVAVRLGAPTEKPIEDQLLDRRGKFALSFTRYLALGTTATFILVGTLGLLSNRPQLLVIACVTMALAASGWLYPALHRRGHMVMGTWICLATFLITIITGLVVIPEITLSEIIGCGVLLVIGNLLLSFRGRVFLAALIALSLVAYNALARGMTFGLGGPPLDPTITKIIDACVSVIGVVIIAAVVHMTVDEQETYFRQSKRASLELEWRATTEQERREYLQATITRYVGYMAEVAKGNLAARVTLDGLGPDTDDPLVVLGRNLNEMTASLQRMIVRVRDAANDLSAAAAEILAATTQQASGASEQSAAISQTTATVDEVKTIAEQASVRAQEVTSASQRAVDVSRTGQGAVQDTIESMGQIKERVEGIAQNILVLSEQTQQIGQIIATVNDLASQSNILALNASVEAARAGEHGRGFAVVAVEVRNLAEQSKRATAQVKAILSEIQRATNATVMATEEGTMRVDQGVQLAAKTREAIQQLSNVINESAQTAIQVTAGGRQQVSGIEQIALAMQNINQATMQSLASTRQAEKAAQDLNGLARSLAATVAQYQL